MIHYGFVQLLLQAPPTGLEQDLNPVCLNGSFDGVLLRSG
jgi:hypothetical protein